MIALFDYIKLVFTRNEKSWKELSEMDKSRNFFMLQRFMAIKHPVQANALSLLRINPSAVADYWHRSMRTQYTSVPTWVYAKTVKKNEEAKKLDLPSDAMIQWYCNKNEISKRDFMESVKFFGNDFLKEIKSLEKILKSQGVLSKD